MAIGIVWLYLGFLYWAVILLGAFVVVLKLPRKKRVMGTCAYFAGTGATVWATSLVPTIGIWVWMPVLFVAMLPFEALKLMLSR